MHELACEHGTQLSFVWQPRTAPALQLADALSKRQDTGDWRLSRVFARQQIFAATGRPDIDCFASERARQDCRWYFSAVWDGRCAAVDALAQDWRAWPEKVAGAVPGRVPLCFVFPPQEHLLSAVSKVLEQRAEAVLVLPRAVGPGVAAVLRQLQDNVVWQAELSGPHACMVQLTAAVPARTSAGGGRCP